MRNLKVN